MRYARKAMRLGSRTGVVGACVRSRAANDGAQALAVRRKCRITARRLLADLRAVSPPITYAANSGGSADESFGTSGLSDWAKRCNSSDDFYITQGRSSKITLPTQTNSK